MTFTQIMVINKMVNQTILNEEVRFTVNAKETGGFLVRLDVAMPCPAIVLLHGSDQSNTQGPYYVTHAENFESQGD